LRTDRGEEAVTFDLDLFDVHPSTLRFLTYGSELLAPLLASVPEPASRPEGPVLRCSTEPPLRRCAYYALDARGRPQRIEHLADLEKVYAEAPAGSGPLWTEGAVEVARAEFEREVATLAQRMAEVVAARQGAERLAVVARARRTLLQAALVELAMAQQPQLSSQEALPMGFSEEAVSGLGRHGFPFAPLLKLVKADSLRPRPTDPFYVELQGQPRETLRRRFMMLESEATRLTGLLAGFPDRDDSSPEAPHVAVQVSLL